MNHVVLIYFLLTRLRSLFLRFTFCFGAFPSFAFCLRDRAFARTRRIVFILAFFASGLRVSAQTRRIVFLPYVWVFWLTLRGDSSCVPSTSVSRSAFCFGAFSRFAFVFGTARLRGLVVSFSFLVPGPLGSDTFPFCFRFGVWASWL